MRTGRLRKPIALLTALLLAWPLFLSSDYVYAGAYQGSLEGPRPNEGGDTGSGGGSVSTGPNAQGSSSGSTAFPGGNASYGASGSVGGASAHGSYSGSVNSSGINANAQGGAQVNVAQGQFDANAQLNAGNVAGANANLNAQGNLGANAQGAGNVDIGLNGINAAGEGNLFAGGQASASSTISLNLFGLEVGIELGGDAYAGLGVNVNGHFQMTGQGTSIGFGAGAAAGVGAGGNAQVFVNYGGLWNNLVNGAGAVGSGIYNIGSSIWNWFGGSPDVQEALPDTSTSMQFDGLMGSWTGGSSQTVFSSGFHANSTSSVSTDSSVSAPCD